MIRMGDKIRLNTEAEKADYRKTTGRMTLPKTVAEHNQAVDEAREALIETGWPEGKLLAMMMENDKL